MSRVGQECCSLLFSCPHLCAETLTIIDSASDPLCYLLHSNYPSLSCSCSFSSLPLSFSLAHPDGIPLSSNTGPPSVSISFFSVVWLAVLGLWSSFSDMQGRSLEHFNLHYARPRIAEGSIKFLLSEAAFSVLRPDQA